MNEQECTIQIKLTVINYLPFEILWFAPTFNKIFGHTQTTINLIQLVRHFEILSGNLVNKNKHFEQNVNTMKAIPDATY